MHSLPSVCSVLEALLLVMALSMDAFVSSFAYGASQIKIPFSSLLIINIVCSSLLALSLCLGSWIGNWIPTQVTSVLCFIILLALGLVKLFDSAIKALIRKHNKVHKKITFSFLNLNFVLNVYANPQDADADASKVLSPKEAIYLAAALSLDGLGVGFGAGLTDVNHGLIVLLSFLIGLLAVMLGCLLGNKLAKKMTSDLSWMGGCILIIIACMKL